MNHRNGLKIDNRQENLEVVDCRENIAHACLTGLRDNKGSNNIKAVLTADDVRTIRVRILNGELPRMIASDYGVQKSCIEKIKYGRLWTHVA